MTGRAESWIRRTTIGCVTMLALIAGTVSYLHMHLLVVSGTANRLSDRYLRAVVRTLAGDRFASGWVAGAPLLGKVNR